MKYLDPNLPTDERIDDLMSHMSLEEKTTQLRYGSPAVERLGVPEYNWWNECLHGVARAGRATVFPQAIALGATFHPDLAFRVAEAIATEGRAKYHHAARHGQRGRYHGITFWTPNINIFRDPRWGRGQETYGEDPYLTGEIGAAFVRGLQGDDDVYLKTAACAKHYAVHSGPEGLRHEFNAQVSDKDLWETYLPAFKKLVDAGVEAVMGAYNRTNGEPCCASTLLMEDILRERWNFQGHYVSDCWAIRDFHEHHKVTGSIAESAALAVKKGCDLNCGSVYEGLMDALDAGLLEESDIDRSLRRLLRTRFRLGMFDPEELVPWSDTPMSVVNSTAHRDLAREVAIESCVLLKNNGVLPISDDRTKVFVTGPAATDQTVLLANYHGVSDRTVTMLEGITNHAGDDRWVGFRQGCGFDTPMRNPVNYAFNEAAEQGIIIMCLGISTYLEGEEGDAYGSDYAGDKRDISLPEQQLDYLRKIAAGDAPVVVIVTGGSPIDLREVHELADAVLFAWYPGEEGGNAIGSLLFGKRGPSGRLPITFPKSLDQLPPFEDYSMAGRTYRYMTEEPMYPFGFGLTYADVRYDDLQIAEGGGGGAADGGAANTGETPEAVGAGVDLELTLHNEGGRGVSEVVQVYVALLENGGDQPLSRLVHTERVWLDGAGVRSETGSRRTLHIHLAEEAFTCVEADGVRRAHRGSWRITAGGSSPGPRAVALGAPAQAEVVVER